MQQVDGRWLVADIKALRHHPGRLLEFIALPRASKSPTAHQLSSRQRSPVVLVIVTPRRPRAAAALIVLAVVAACGSPTPPPNLPVPKSPKAPARGGGAPASPPTADNAALTAGTAFALHFFSPDYRSLDDYVARVDAGSLGAFQHDFDAKKARLRTMLTLVRSSAHAHVLAAAVRETTPTSAVELIALDQSIRSSTTGGKEVTNRYSVIEQLRLIDGKWVVVTLEQLVDNPYAPRCPDPTTAPERDDLLRQTCNDITKLYGYDYRDLDAAIAAQHAVSVGSVQEQVDTATGPALRAQAPKTQAVVVAQVNSAAVETAEGGTATLLVFVNQAVDTNLLPQPRLDRNRLEVTMQRVDGRWLVADIKVL